MLTDGRPSGEEGVAPTETALRDWIRDHKVTWELGPWQEMVDHHPAVVGFELRLLARHIPHAHPQPGCDQCVRVYQWLREIALGALPRDHRPTRYEFEPFDASFHLSTPHHKYTNVPALALAALPWYPLRSSGGGTSAKKQPISNPTVQGGNEGADAASQQIYVAVLSGHPRQDDPLGSSGPLQ